MSSLYQVTTVLFGQLEKQGTGNGTGTGTGNGTGTGTGTETTRAGCYTVYFTSLQTTKLRQATAWYIGLGYLVRQEVGS